MSNVNRLWFVSLILILGLLLAGCGGGGLALQGEGGLDVELPNGGEGQETEGGADTARTGPTPLMWLLIVAAVFVVAAVFFRGGLR